MFGCQDFGTPVVYRANTVKRTEMNLNFNSKYILLLFFIY